MAYVIAEPCIGTKDTACVDACPVDCIHPKKDEPGYAEAEMLYIDPVECIDCGACVPVCPVSAIFALDDLPEKWTEFTAKNAAYYGDSRTRGTAAPDIRTCVRAVSKSTVKPRCALRSRPIGRAGRIGFPDLDFATRTGPRPGRPQFRRRNTSPYSRPRD